MIIIYFASGGFCFLNETLPKAKEAFKSSETAEESDDIESTMTDIEMMPNHNGINGEVVIRESDINTEITETYTDIVRDTKILVKPDKSTQNSQHSVAFLRRVRKAVKAFSFTSIRRKFITHHKKQCVACCHCYYTKSRSQSIRSLITSCEVWNQFGGGVVSNFKQIIRLLLDRRVILSTLIYGIMGYVAVMSNEVSCIKSE